MIHDLLLPPIMDHNNQEQNHYSTITTVRCFIFFTFIFIPSALCQDDEQFRTCSIPFNCGDMKEIWYPFWGNSRPQTCGREGFNLTCHENQYPLIEIESHEYRVLGFNESHHIMTVAREELIDDEDFCHLLSDGITEINETVFHYYRPNVTYLDVYYDCSEDLQLDGRNNFSCTVDNRDQISGFYTFTNQNWRSEFQNLSSLCSKKAKVAVSVDAYGNLENGDLRGALKRGFAVEYSEDNLSCSRCKNSEGNCGRNLTNPEQFVCFCSDGPREQICAPTATPSHASTATPTPSHQARTGLSVNLLSRFVIGVGAACAGVAVSVIIYIVISRCKFKHIKNDKDLEEFIRNHGSLAPKRYSFSEIKKMTKSFKDKLGQGGFGHVYKGKLSDDHLVAVKLLNTSKGDGQEFINEVASISRTSHVNIVTLVGFCLEGDKRALIYEFMPNGSLEKFIVHSKDTNSATNILLGWEKLYQIALGIARGLEYLHRGCNTRIVHFDIKPHNILLDEEFGPKISDFGLAKLGNGRESIMSMLEARGTIGYIAPEVLSRNFGGVSYKSDVYSYGMMILDMVGVRNNVDVREGDSKSSMYFPDWIYMQIEAGEDDEESKLVMGDMNKEEDEMVRKMMIVGLWCIQTWPSSRPCINKVIEMLQGDIEALQIPPKPSLYFPPRPPIDDPSFIITSMSS